MGATGQLKAEHEGIKSFPRLVVQVKKSSQGLNLRISQMMGVPRVCVPKTMFDK